MAYPINSNNQKDNKLLFDIIEQKEDLIENLKDKNNKKINLTLSKISTNKDIQYVMNNNKILINKINLLTEHNKSLTQNILINNRTCNNLKNIYYGLNNIYVSKCNDVEQNNNNSFVLSSKVKILEEKLNNVQNIFKCQICYNNNIDIIIQPCYHIYICKVCIESIIENTNTGDDVNCPVCNEKVEEYKNIYLPI